MKLGFLLLCTLIIYDNNTLHCHIKEFSLSSFPENYILLGKKKEPFNFTSKLSLAKSKWPNYRKPEIHDQLVWSFRHRHFGAIKEFQDDVVT